MLVFYQPASDLLAWRASTTSYFCTLLKRDSSRAFAHMIAGVAALSRAERTNRDLAAEDDAAG